MASLITCKPPRRRGGPLDGVKSSGGTFSGVVIGMAAAAVMIIAKNAMLNLCVILFVGFSEKGRLPAAMGMSMCQSKRNINSVPDF